MDSYIPLISTWEDYLAISKSPAITDFAMWILKQKKPEVANDQLGLDTYVKSKTEEHNYAYKSSDAAILLWRMSKFIRYYTKPVLLENGLASQDDFGILAHIDYKKSCSKGEAIEANIIDATTGIEIIKRLIKQGLVSEKHNKDDKRQRIISLTKAGKEKLYKIYMGFSKIQDVMADLNVQQREILIQTLEKLDLFHTQNIKS